MNLRLVAGDLLDQDVDVIVNAWNRNVIPWWLLLPQGVSGGIKRRDGHAPFKEVARHGPIPLGGAVASVKVWHSTGTDRSGEFTLTGLAEGVYEVEIEPRVTDEWGNPLGLRPSGPTRARAGANGLVLPLLPVPGPPGDEKR